MQARDRRRGSKRGECQVVLQLGLVRLSLLPVWRLNPHVTVSSILVPSPHVIFILALGEKIGKGVSRCHVGGVPGVGQPFRQVRMMASATRNPNTSKEANQRRGDGRANVAPTLPSYRGSAASVPVEWNRDPSGIQAESTPGTPFSLRHFSARQDGLKIVDGEGSVSRQVRS